jgi:hypothetical protein
MSYQAGPERAVQVAGTVVGQNELIFLWPQWTVSTEDWLLSQSQEM